MTLDEIADEVVVYIAKLRDLFVEDYAVARRRADELNRDLEARKGSFLADFLGSLPRAALIQRRLIATRQGARCVLALHAYKAKHGRWPAKLEDALPDKLAKFALDPFSNNPLVYELKDGGEPRLYSVAENGNDDGGDVFKKDGKPGWGETGDYVFWPRE
jgi:hypothetical protein